MIGIYIGMESEDLWNHRKAQLQTAAYPCTWYSIKPSAIWLSARTMFIQLEAENII